MRHAVQLTQDVERLRQELSKNRAIPLSSSAADDPVSTGALVNAATSVDRLVTSLYAGAADSVATWPQLAEQLSLLHRLSQLYLRSVEASR